MCSARRRMSSHENIVQFSTSSTTYQPSAVAAGLSVAPSVVRLKVTPILPHAVNCGRFCFWRRLSVVFGRPFVKRFALCYRTVVLSVLSVCLSVTLVYCCQTVRRITMKLGTEVGLGPGHIMLDGDPAPTYERGTTAPTFRPIVAKRSPISAAAELLFVCV